LGVPPLFDRDPGYARRSCAKAGSRYPLYSSLRCGVPLLSLTRCAVPGALLSDNGQLRTDNWNRVSGVAGKPGPSEAEGGLGGADTTGQEPAHTFFRSKSNARDLRSDPAQQYTGEIGHDQRRSHSGFGAVRNVHVDPPVAIGFAFPFAPRTAIDLAFAVQSSGCHVPRFSDHVA